MKKAFLLFAFLLAAFQAVYAQIVVSGDVTSNTTWTKNNTYLLNGFVYVTNGAVLTIEAGTVIKGDKATKGTLIVTRGAKIIADGTPNDPIVFTSNESTPGYGDWGGIILLGYAPANQVYNGTAGLGLIEGGLDAVKGLYGGGDQTGGAVADDNSGILRYVRIEYPGIAFQPNNEINGLTMGGVGNKTTIDYVQVSYSGDDSFEWFGGTVNCKHLIAYRGLDDDFDTDNGYSGNIQFAYAVRDPNVADVSGSNGFESDNNAAGDGTKPKTKATFSNVTVIGPSGSATVNSNYKRAAHLRRNTELGIFNSVEIGKYPVGILIDGDSAVNNAIAGRLSVRNSFFYGMTKLLDTTKVTVPFDINTWASGRAITTGGNAADAGLVDPFNLALPNPRPSATSPLLNAASFSDPRLTDPFYVQVGYAGAFGPSGDWTCPWAKFETAGCAASPESVVSGNISQNTTWTADKTYVLNGFVYVTNCATLTIQPGTVIKGDKGSKGALIVTRCSKIIADGTQDLPIVFTTNDPNPTYGSWGGLILLGYASTNQVYNGTPGLGLIEGGIDPVKGLYGGGDQAGGAKDNDNSGILRYVRVEYPGIAFQPNNEINGITFGAVGSGTTIDHVQVSYSGDDSYEWFGGTVNCKHLIAYRGLDDDFDADNGFSGNIQYALAVRDPQVADVSGSNGFEVDNNVSGDDTAPKTAPTFSNVTIAGPTGTGINSNFKRAAHLRRDCEIGIFNTLLLGSYPVGVFIDGNSTAENAQNGKLEIKNTQVHGPTDLLNTNASNGFDVDVWFATAGSGNATNANPNGAALQNPYDLDVPNAQPTGLSPAIGGAAFTATRIDKPFFDKVTYVGAFGGTDDWTCGWAKFLDLNTSCLTETNNADQYISSVKLFPTVATDQATLQMTLSAPADLSVEIYNMEGQYFGQRVNEKASAGEQTYTLSTLTLSSGFYFVRIQAGSAVKTEKLIVVR